MTRPHAPLTPGTRISHAAQQWATRTRYPQGTAVIVGADSTPCADGSWEYDVLRCRDFSRGPGPDNPMDTPTRWNSLAIRRHTEGDPQ